MAGASRPTVDKWLARYEQCGLEGLVSKTSPGGPRQIPERIRARVLALTRTTPPSVLGISHWSSTEVAGYIKRTEGVYVSQTWVSRLWRENGLRPWAQGTFKISRDPDFEDKVGDVVGLYLDPPEGEVVVSVDAKSVSRRWTARSRCCRSTSARRRSGRSIMRGWGPRICTPPWISGRVV